ncbi:hypothetical protein ACJVQT_23020 [Enterobacter huaxiensis]|uniref:hypothetical protein n=1 Tax=Enterobacter huaxiensis TaxID=2494702 RepID=UPI002175734C|nr:hypothetical protein [Enterobacter huaxiensis]MCS5452539.1 hypothetical protein [Enterobacter huaxiensis]
MGYIEIKPTQRNLVEMQRLGKLYWWDVEYRFAKIASLPHRLSPQRRDFTEEALKKWAFRGELFTYEN